MATLVGNPLASRDQQIADLEGLVAVDQLAAGWGSAGIGTGHAGAVGHPEPQLVASRQRQSARQVVAVFVGDQDPGQRLRLDTQARQPGEGLARAKTAVDEDPGGSRLDQQRVAAAAAAERGEAHHFNWS